MAPTSAGPQHGGAELLVVDGDPGTRRLLREFLTGAGFPSDEADDLPTALARVAGARPAAVVLHDGIPGAQGVEILESLRAYHPELPVVFIANVPGPDVRAAVSRFTATALLAKPFRMGDLLAAVVRTVHHPVPPSRARRSPGRSGARRDRLDPLGRLEGANLARDRTA